MKKTQIASAPDQQAKIDALLEAAKGVLNVNTGAAWQTDEIKRNANLALIAAIQKAEGVTT